MLLIVFVGLVAKLLLVSGDCEVGTASVKVFDFAKATGTWFVLLHKPNDVENSLSCVRATYGPPEGNICKVTLDAYIISAKTSYSLEGKATYQSGNEFDEDFGQSIWTGSYYVIAVDYDNYIILKMCSSDSGEMYIYVAYRSKNPDKKIVKKAMKDLEENKIDVNQLVKWDVDNCQ